MRRKRRHQSRQGNFAHATKQADLSHAMDAGVHHDMFVRAPEYADFEVDLGIPPRLMSPIYISDENDCKPPRKLSPNAVSNGSSPIASQAALAMSMTINCDEASILPSTRATCQMSAPKIARKEIAETQTQNEANLKPVLSETATQVSVQLTDSLGLSSSLMSDTDTGVCNAAPNLGDGEERTEFVSAPQDLDSRNLDDRLLDILKRLDKPDVTTRQKALRDLSSLLQYKDPLTFSVVIAFLPYWSPVFCRLSEDADANVRKFTQMVMFRLVRRVYHELRPYLKQVLPLWVYGSTDRHSEASRWAHEGLSTAFLKVRNFEAHRLCAEQLLCLLENKIELAVSQFFPLFAAKKGIARQHAKDEMPCDSEIDLALERLARAVQFCRLVVIRLASLPDDNPYLQRLRSQLSPENLWSRVSRAVELSIWQSEFFLENAFEVHQSLYDLSESLCTNEYWRRWLSHTPQGSHLASYLCASTLGQLGIEPECTTATVPQTYTLIPSPLRLNIGTSCYSFFWDAAIACLVNLPDNLVWSTVDWRSNLAPQLEYMFLHADLELVSEACQGLLDLLRRLPVDFSALDEADCDMLQRIFITAPLSGLEPSLVLRPAFGSLSFDMLLDAIHGVLRCARFMLDKTVPSGSFNSLDDLYRSSPLLHAVMRDMILRLLGVALDVYWDASKPCLKSTRLTMGREDYLYPIFSQVANLCVDMGNSDMCSKHLLLAHICDQIVQWSSEDPAIEMTDPCEPDTKCSQLGLIDPLRLIGFADAIAELDYPPWSMPPLPQTNRSPGSATQRTGYFVMKSEWCIALFTSLAKEVERRLNSAAMNTSLRSCLYLALFCLHGHLLDYYPCLISSFSSTLFSVILPGLPENIRWESLSSSVVRGLTRSWSLSDDAAPLHFPSNSICLQFFDHLYPTILNTLLFDSENLFRNIANLFSHLLAYWCAKSVLIETTDDDASSSLINISLLFHALSLSWFRNRERLPMIKESVFRKVADWIRPFFSGSVDMLKVHPPRIIHRLFVILLLALESDFSTDFDRRSRCCLQLGQLLFAMYRIHHFALVAEVLTPDSPLVLFTSEMVTSGHRPPLSLSNAFQRAERLLLSHVSSRIRDPNPTGDPYALAHSIYNLLFKIVQYSPYVSPRFIRFAKSLATQCPTPALASIWLSELTELIQKLSVCPFTDSCSPRSALFSVPTRHLLPSFGLSVDRALLASLVRLHQLGWQMGLPRQLRTVDSEHRQYIQCLSLLSAWLRGVSEPYDSCTELGWPILAFSTSDNLWDPSAPSNHPHMEPVRSSFGCTTDLLQNKYKYLWRSTTVHLSIHDLLDVLSINRRSSLFAPNPYALFRLSSTLNAVALNHVRSLHPNLFPHLFLLACSCADDPDMMCSSWCEQYLLPKMHPVDPLDELIFHRACELYLPAGVLRRCLPRQELIGILRSLSTNGSISPSDQTNPNSCASHATAARILAVCSALACVRVATPIYVSLCLPIFTEDYRCWLTKLCDSLDRRVPDAWKSHSTYLASLAALSFTESLFSLWQPWELTTHKLNRSSTSHRLSLIRRSLRLRFRPSLTLSHWDFFISLVVSWVCSVANSLFDSSTPLEDHDRLFAFRSFRAATALAAVFLDCHMSPVILDAVLVPHAAASGGDGGCPLPLDDSTGDEWGDDLDAEAEQADLKDLYVNIRDDDIIMDSDNVLESTENTEALPLDFSEEIDEGQESVLILDETDEVNGTRVADNEPILPLRGRPPPSVRTDWDTFFSSHLYSNLLPIVLRSCLSQSNSSVSCSQMDTPFHLQALCAAFATCPTSQLIRLFADNPRLILEYVVDLEVSDCSSSLSVVPLISSRNCSVSQFVPGLRASFELAIRLLRFSPFQSGQLLGHILLTRLISTRTQRPGSDATSNLSNYLVHRLPTSLMLALSGPLPESLECDLVSESVFDYWGRGSRALTYVTVFSVQDGWSLDLSAHRSILGYLLAWDCLLSLFTCAGPHAGARLQRALLGRSASLLDKFMMCLGLLLPPTCDLKAFMKSLSRLEPPEGLMLPVSATWTNLISTVSSFSSETHRRAVRLPATPASDDVQCWDEPFGPDDPLLFLPGHRLSRDLSHFAVRLLCRFLSEAPALFRNWFLRLRSLKSDGSTSIAHPQSPLALHNPRRLRFFSNAVRSLITGYFATDIARDEVILVQDRALIRRVKLDEGASKSWLSLWNSSKEVGSITIKCRPLLRKLIATCRMTEEHSVEMIIQLPPNYPLSLTTVTCWPRAAVSSQQCHVWSDQLAKFINNQNGSILNGIDLWQQNVRKKFEGVEECAICYSILHNTNFSLPKMQCHSCRKLFHYACIYHHLTTNVTRVCPLCRDPFFDPCGRSE